MKLKIFIFSQSKWTGEIHYRNMIIFLSNVHWVPTSSSEQNTKFLNLNIEKELEAHLFRIRSTHEYYNLA